MFNSQFRLIPNLSIITTLGLPLMLVVSAGAQSALPAKKVTTTEVSEGAEVIPATSYNGQPIYQFNVLGTPTKSSDRDSLTFKVPTDDKALADDRMANPVENQKNDAPFKTYIGYPKQRLTVGYAPVSYSGKFTYTGSGTGQGTDFSFTSSSVTGLNLGYQFLPTPTTYIEAESNYLSASTNDGSPNPFTVNKSTANVFNLFVRGNYCFVGDNFFSRLCPGAEIGMDSYPLLGFIDNSTMEMQQATELSYGVNLLFSGPLVKSVIGKTRIGYLMGSGVGQSGLTSKKNSAYYVAPQIEWPAMGGYINIGFNYLSRNSSVEGKKGVNTEKWDTTLSSFTMLAGFTLEFAN